VVKTEEGYGQDIDHNCFVRTSWNS